jgi:hypothetical protein
MHLFNVMKKFISLAFIVISAGFVFAQDPTLQQKPLTQAEYVKLLYDLEKNPKKRGEVIETVRKRGIGFVVTDGIRGLTVTKSRNDAELKSALEESSRRRENPTASQLPSEKESAEVLAKAREANLAAVDEMPDFVVKQLVSRYTGFAGRNNWTPLDRLVLAVSYSAEKGEQYRILSINGTTADVKAGSAYSSLLSGSTTTGEFVDELSRIFKAESKTEFTLVDTGTIRARKAIVYQFQIALENNKGDGITYSSGSFKSSVPVGQKGKVWIDRETYRVLRIEYQVTDMPQSFPIKAFDQSIDYDWIQIADAKYLLPIVADGRFTTLNSNELTQKRNLIRFKDYQKYGTDVKILDSDDEEVPEEKP